MQSAATLGSLEFVQTGVFPVDELPNAHVKLFRGSQSLWWKHNAWAVIFFFHLSLLLHTESHREWNAVQIKPSGKQRQTRQTVANSSPTCDSCWCRSENHSGVSCNSVMEQLEDSYNSLKRTSLFVWQNARLERHAFYIPSCIIIMGLFVVSFIFKWEINYPCQPYQERIIKSIG